MLSATLGPDPVPTLLCRRPGSGTAYAQGCRCRHLFMPSVCWTGQARRSGMMTRCGDPKGKWVL